MAKKRANGEGNIRKRSDGRWEGRYTAGYDPQTGKRIIKNVLGKTQAEVKAKLAKALEDSKELDIVRTDEYTVAEWLRLWYELYAEPNVRPTTAASYRRNIELHVIPHIGDIKLNRLTSRELQKFYKDLLENGRLREAQKEKKPGLSNSTVRGIHMMLHNALDRAVRERLILRNPTEDCIIPKLEKKEMKILRPEDIKAYLAAAEREGVVLDVSGDLPKSFVVCQEGVGARGQIRGGMAGAPVPSSHRKQSGPVHQVYISQLSAATLLRRAENGSFEFAAD